MGFPWQEDWSGLPFPSPVGLPRSEIKPVSPVSAVRFFTTEPPGKPKGTMYVCVCVCVYVCVYIYIYI